MPEIHRIQFQEELTRLEEQALGALDLVVVTLDAIVSMRLNAVVIDIAVLGPQGWSYLEKLCTRLPGLGVIVCTGRSSVAQRVRGLRLGMLYFATAFYGFFAGWLVIVQVQAYLQN